MGLKTAKGRILFFLFFVLAFPALQQNLAFFKSGDLTGAYTNTVNPSFRWNKWWDGSYQTQKNAYLNDNAGCRQDLVRVNNQLDYSLFKKFHTGEGLLLGKNDCFFQEYYINEYKGLDFAGDEVIKNELIKLKKIQDTLEKLGKTFVFVFAPSKAWYFPEYFPAVFDTVKTRKQTNYKIFKQYSDSFKINTIDFNGWFMAMKDTTKELLFSKLGIHWTTYGALISEDSMVKYIDVHRHISMPRPMWNAVEHTDEARNYDDDLAQWLNIIVKLKMDRLAYPIVNYEQDANKTRPKTIFIGDSFFWPWVKCHFMDESTNDWEYWYYFNVVWNAKSLNEGHPLCKIKDYDWPKALLNTECIIMLFNSANFKNLNCSDCLIDQMYNNYYNK